MGAHDEGDDGARVGRRERSVAAALDLRDLGVHRAADLLEEHRIAERFGEEAHPGARGGDVAPFAK